MSDENVWNHMQEPSVEFVAANNGLISVSHFLTPLSFYVFLRIPKPVFLLITRLWDFLKHSHVNGLIQQFLGRRVQGKVRPREELFLESSTCSVISLFQPIVHKNEVLLVKH